MALRGFGYDLWKPSQPSNAASEWGFEGVHSLGLMPTATGVSIPLAAQRKTAARVALFDLPEKSAQMMTECFRQFGIETVPIPRK